MAWSREVNSTETNTSLGSSTARYSRWLVASRLACGTSAVKRGFQAAATRREILAAAQGLFAHRGYAGTTMDAIAAEVGVALKTVYLALETKSGLLRALWDTRLRGDEHDAPVAEQTWYREVLDEPDPVR